MSSSQTQIEIGKKFYCKGCKTFFTELEVDIQIINLKSEISRYKRYLCPNCKISMIPICPSCKQGFMVKTELPKTCDYNKQGNVEAFCTNCGHGYIYLKDGYRVFSRISKRNIEKLLNKIIMKNNLPLSNFKEIQRYIYKNLRNRFEIIDYITDEFNIPRDFIEENLVGQILILG